MGPQNTSVGLQDVQDSLAASFEQSAGTVRKYADTFEHKYARPALDFCFESFDSSPTLSTFAAIFILLSIFPVVTFIGFSLFALASILSIALSCASIAFLAVELLFASVAVSVLVFLLFVSLGLTAAAIGTYLTIRFVVLIRAEGREGVGEWLSETRQHFVKPKARGRQQRASGSQSSSDASIVLVSDRENVHPVPLAEELVIPTRELS